MKGLYLTNPVLKDIYLVSSFHSINHITISSSEQCMGFMGGITGLEYANLKFWYNCQTATLKDYTYLKFHQWFTRMPMPHTTLVLDIFILLILANQDLFDY